MAQRMNILVVGGAGYIGSHMVKMLDENGHHVITFDNLSTGYRDSVLAGEFVYGDLADKKKISDVFSKYEIDVVMHFASYIQVGESVSSPEKYYANNVVNTLNLLDAMIESDVKKFVFSSTAAVFGEPNYTPIDELHSTIPINPYGRTKLFVEGILRDYDTAHNLKYVSLRYFNAAGADPRGDIGERHEPETHLIPLVLQAASNRRKHICVYGMDYNTDDGTCVRDYIHVNDICKAHLLAVDYLSESGASNEYNLGNGSGFSVNEVIEAARTVTGRDILVEYGPRRIGDPAILIADSTKIRNELGWKPEFTAIEKIVEHAWVWEEKNIRMEDS